MNVEQMRELVESLETMHGLMVKMAEQGIKGYELLAKELNHDYTDLSEEFATAAAMYRQVRDLLASHTLHDQDCWLRRVGRSEWEEFIAHEWYRATR